MNQYNEAFNNLAKTLDIKPGESTNKLKNSTVANFPSNNVLDSKDHFPALTETQAQSSMSRVISLTEVPPWYNGTITALRSEVYANIKKTHPNINFNVRVPANMIIALSDGQTPPETTIKSPLTPKSGNEVPQVKRGTITKADLDENTQKTLAGLIETIDKRLNHIQTTKDLAKRLLESGITGEEFNKLNEYLQMETVSELMMNGIKASENRRLELINKLK